MLTGLYEHTFYFVTVCIVIYCKKNSATMYFSGASASRGHSKRQMLWKVWRNMWVVSSDTHKHWTLNNLLATVWCCAKIADHFTLTKKRQTNIYKRPANWSRIMFLASFIVLYESEVLKIILISKFICILLWRSFWLFPFFVYWK
jgi:hypothetical protein